MKKPFCTILSSAVLALSLACSSSDKEGASASNGLIDTNADYAVLEKGTTSSYTGTSTQVFTSQAAWQNHYNLHRGDTFVASTAPLVNFSTEDLVAIHLGSRPSPAYSVQMSSYSYDTTDNVNHVRYIEIIDETQTWPAQVSYPYIFVRVPKSNVEIRFINNGTSTKK